MPDPAPRRRFWIREFSYISFRLYKSLDHKMRIGWCEYYEARDASFAAALAGSADGSASVSVSGSGTNGPASGSGSGSSACDSLHEMRVSGTPGYANGFSLLTTSEWALVLLLPLVEWLLWLLPLILFLWMTLSTMEAFSVATAVKQVDNAIIGTMEQEQEQAGAYVQAMLLQRNHLARTYPDLTSYKNIKDRVASQVTTRRCLGHERPCPPRCLLVSLVASSAHSAPRADQARGDVLAVQGGSQE